MNTALSMHESRSQGWMPEKYGRSDGSPPHCTQHAAVNTGLYGLAALPSGDGGGRGERGEPAGCTGAGRAGAPQGGRGDRSAVQFRRVLPACGQGAGQVRDAAGTPDRARPGDGGRGGSRVLAGRVLPGRGGLRRAGLPRRSSRRGPPAVDPARRPARAGTGGDLSVPARRGRRAGRGRLCGNGGILMKAAIYARVSTERQAERGTIGSQVEALRAHVAAAGDELAGEYCDDGHSGARLDRPGLDEMRDAAEAGLFEVVWCLSPDRLARSYAYQVLILDELARLGVAVRFTDAPGLDEHDPQARLLTQVQGVIAEYERAKIGERYRRGKLFRSRAGEVISRKAPYGYRRIPRGPDGPAHLDIFEPEAAVARRIFAERAAGTTIRQICRQLNADAVPTPTGSRAVWGTSTLDRLLRNEAYIGRTYFNRTETVPDRRPGHRSRQVPRPRADWIAIPCPAVIADQAFQAAGKASTDNAKWSPRRAEPGAWLLRGLVKCGPCGVGTSCHKMRGRNGTWHRYYYCHNHDPLRAGGQDRRCPERNIRADALDEFVFTQIRAALLDPALLLAGEQAIAVHAPVPDDQLLAAELARLDRKLDTARSEHNRLIDLYQAGLIDMPELQRRAAAITTRQRDVEQKRASLAAERADLARGNRLRHGVEHFAARVRAVIDQLDHAQRQQLLRLLIEDVQVTGWHVKIRLRIPLDNPPDGDPAHHQTPSPRPAPASSSTPPVSTEDRLRSLHDHDIRVMQ